MDTERRTRHNDDEALLEALEARELDALNELWARYADVAYAAAVVLVGDSSIAGDAVIAAFMMLWRTPDAGRHEPLSQHLVAAVRRCCVEQVAPSSMSPSPVVLAGASTAARAAPTWALTDQQLTTVALVTTRRFSTRDVAGLLGIEHSAVCASLGEVLTTVADR